MNDLLHPRLSSLSSVNLRPHVLNSSKNRWPTARFGQIWLVFLLEIHKLPVSLHFNAVFNQSGHSINDVCLIFLELIRSDRDPVRKSLEAHLIHKGKTLSPLGVNRRNEARWHTILLSQIHQSQSIVLILYFQTLICNELSVLSSFFF